jgi:CheY-like chemotaxis protein
MRMKTSSDLDDIVSERATINSTPSFDPPILIVDDSVVSRRLAAQIIGRGSGRSVIEAENGLKALELLETAHPAAVLTDLQMPGMDGLELVEMVRTRHPEIPVVLMTAYGSETVAMNALRAGAANYVPKKNLARSLVPILDQVFAVVEKSQRRHKLLASQTTRIARFEVENDPNLLAPLISLLQEDLVAFGIGDETERVRVGVALQESLANALFHGNLECSSDLRQDDERVFYRLADQRRALEPYRSRRIHVESNVSRERAEIMIRDEGPGFDVSNLDKPLDPEDLMRIGGRGMLLIRTFMDEIRHNHTGNEITMIKRRSG